MDYAETAIASKPQDRQFELKAEEQKPVRKQTKAFFFALALFVIINLALSDCIRPKQENLSEELAKPVDLKVGRPWSYWIAKAYQAQSEAPDVVVFGSSQMGSAAATADAQRNFRVVDVITHRTIDVLKEDLFKQSGLNLKVASLANPGAMISDAYMASDVLLKGKLKPKIALITISPRDFIDNTLPYPGVTDQFKFFSRFTAIESVKAQAFSDPFVLLDYETRRIPLKILGLSLLKQNESGDTAASNAASDGSGAGALAAVMAASANVRPGQWVVPANIPAIWQDNTREYKNRYRNPSLNYEAEMAFFRAWLAQLKQRDIIPVVVTMPSLPMNRALLKPEFWRRYQADLKAACAVYGVSFVELADSPDFVQSDYLDTVHLNAWGGFKLFPKLAGILLASPGVKERCSARD